MLYSALSSPPLTTSPLESIITSLGESIKQIDFTHAFLGLTKGKSPDELDKADETLRQEYLKNKEFKLIKSIK
ncbi:hypothetical protein AEI18_04245 [Campylobacter jejuni]|nr:hypothetical protein AEI18_04245 [Campylobacter jejuni]